MFRNTIYCVVLSVAILLVVTGCSEDEYSGVLSASLNERYLYLDRTTFEFPSSASNYYAYVTSRSTPWKTTSPASWLSISPSSGNGNDAETELTFSVGENTSGEEARTAVGYLESNVTDWKYSIPYNVSQNAATPKLNFESSSIAVSGAAQTFNVGVNANISWYPSMSSPSSTWISAEIADDGKSVNITVAANTTSGTRTGYVYVRGSNNSNKSSQLIIYQSSATVTPSATALNCSNSAATYTLSITSDAAWSASTTDSWITDISPSTGSAGTTTVQVKVAENATINSRVGSIVFDIGSSKKSVTVTQDGVKLNLDSNNVTFASTGETKTITVDSNTDWTVTSSSEWIVVTPESGKNGGTVSVTVSENNSIIDRTGTLTFEVKGLISKGVVVTQNGKTLNLGSSGIVFSDTEGTQTVEIKTDGDWTASCDYDWITITPTSGHGNATLSVSVPENTSKETRTGSITVKMAEIEKGVTVTQTGKYFSIDNNSLTISSKGGKLSVAISSNDKWKASITDNPDWVTISATEGFGNIEATLTLADNPSVKERSATVEFSSNSGYTVALVVRQEARYLRLSARKMYFYYDTTTTDPVTIDTDGEYSITKSGDWFTLNRDINSFTIVAAENNTAYMRSGKVTVALTDLKEGELSLDVDILQYSKGGNFINDGYVSDDTNYDSGANSGTIGLENGYGTDNDWDGGSLSFTITIVGYSSDDVNNEGSTNVTIGGSGYGSDTNNDGGSGSGTIGGSGYGSDANNDGSSGSGTIGNSGYGSDTNNDGNSGSGTIGGSGYGSDTNNDSGSGSGTIGGSGYGSDTNNDGGSGSGTIGNSGYGSDTNNDSGSGSGTIGGSGYGSDTNHDEQ